MENGSGGQWMGVDIPDWTGHGFGVMPSRLPVRGTRLDLV